MPTNIEIKARVHEMKHLESNVRSMTKAEPILLYQEDYKEHGRNSVRSFFFLYSSARYTAMSR